MRYESRFRFTVIVLLSLLLVIIGSQNIRAQSAWLAGIEITYPQSTTVAEGIIEIVAETVGTGVGSGPFFYVPGNTNIGTADAWEYFHTDNDSIYDGIRYFKDYDTRSIEYSTTIRFSVKVETNSGQEFWDYVYNVTIDNREFEPPDVNLQYPPNNKLIYGPPIDFNWDSDLPNDATYVFKLSKSDNSFSFETNTGQNSQYRYENALSDGGSYQWRIGFEVNNSIGGWSDPYSFDYTNTLNPISQSNDDIVYEPNVQLTWSQSGKPYNCKFRVQLDGVNPPVDITTPYYSYNANNLDDNTQYQWRVCNWHTETGSVNNWTEYQTFTTDFIPDAPTGLTISGSTGDNPVLTWNANSEPDINGYYVYRNVGTGYNKLNTNPISSTTYTDPVTIVKFDGVSTSYYVTAIDNDTNESPSSNTVTIKQNTVFPVAKDVINESEAISTVTRSSIKSFPNPFNPETTITFQLKDDSYVNMQIFNIRGQLVRSLVNNNFKTGQYTLKWDSKDNIGRNVPSGVYLCHIDAENFHKSIKLLLVR